MAAPLPPHAAPGTVLSGKYVLESVIGRGGMGVVLAARHIALGKRVAVKLLLTEADDATRARFDLEARAAARLTSPNVAQVIDYGVTREGMPWLVMEYLEGRDLAALRKERGGRLPIDEAVDLVIEACIGLAHAHGHGLIHRDVKPANLFLARSAGRSIVKVLDFGLIKVKDGDAALTGTLETFGTPKYMSPEHLRSARIVDERSDQHAIAAVLFELVAGRAPFVGDGVPAILHAIATETAPTLERLHVACPRALDAALQRALAKNPNERFASLAEFASEIAPAGGPRAARLAEDVRVALYAATAHPTGDDVRTARLAPTVERPDLPTAITDDLATRVRPLASGTGAPSAEVGPAVPPPSIGRSPSARSEDAAMSRVAIPRSASLDPSALRPPRTRSTGLLAAFAATGLALAGVVGYLVAHGDGPSSGTASEAPSTSSLAAPRASDASPSPSPETTWIASLPAPVAKPSTSSPPSSSLADATPSARPSTSAPSFRPPSTTTAPAKPVCTGGLLCY